MFHFYMRINHFSKSTCNGSLRITWKKFYFQISQAHYPMAKVSENSLLLLCLPGRTSLGQDSGPVSSISRGRRVPYSVSFLGTGHTGRKCSLTGAHLRRICFMWYFGQHLTPKGSQQGILDVI